MSRTLFAAKHVKTVLRMSRPLFVGNYCRSRGGLSANGNINMENPTTVRKIRIFFYRVKKSLLENCFQKYTLKVPASSHFFLNLGKFAIPLNQPEWSMKFTQNCTFSTGQYRKKGTCLDFLLFNHSINKFKNL